VDADQGGGPALRVFALVRTSLSRLSPPPPAVDRTPLGRVDGEPAQAPGPVCPWVDGLLQHLRQLPPDP
jgi:hypothetical protein